jgi:hypothetical protein
MLPLFILVLLFTESCSKNASEAIPDVDGDGDGCIVSEDCDDTDATINPDATEICDDGIDQNCNGLVDEGCAIYYLDGDGDGYGDSTVSLVDTAPPVGYVSDNTDCNDTDATINPGAYEVCNDGIDNDCDGIDTDDCDGDSISVADGDCDDNNATVFPGAVETGCDDIDQDCDGADDLVNCTNTFEIVLSGAFNQYAYDGQETSDGGFIMIGSTEYYGAAENMYLVKTDSYGKKLWAKDYGGSDDELAYSGQETSDGGFILFGRTFSFGAGKADLYLLKTDASGNELWSKTFGGADNDYGTSVQETSDGGFIMLAYTYSFGNGGSDFYLVKADKDGNELWSKTFGGSGREWSTAVKETSDGGFIMCGSTESFGVSISGIYFIKTDSSGTKLWDKIFDGSGYDNSNSLIETSDGDFILFGETTSYGAGNDDMYLIKTDSSGNKLWSKTIGDAGYNWGNSIQETPDGGFILLGSSEPFGSDWSDFHIIKTDSEGNELWSNTFGGIYDDWGSKVQATSDGGFILIGHALTSFYHDLYIIKTYGNGNVP